MDPYDSPFKVPYSSPQHPFRHSLQRTGLRFRGQGSRLAAGTRVRYMTFAGALWGSAEVIACYMGLLQHASA